MEDRCKETGKRDLRIPVRGDGKGSTWDNQMPYGYRGKTKKRERHLKLPVRKIVEGHQAEAELVAAYDRSTKQDMLVVICLVASFEVVVVSADYNLHSR